MPISDNGNTFLKIGLSLWVSTNLVNEDYLEIRNRSLSKGQMFTENDVKTYAKVCLLGQTTVNHLFPKGVDPIGKVIRFGKVPFQVVGILSPKGKSMFGQDQDDVIVSPFTTVQKRVLASIYFGGIYASARSEALSDVATAEVIEILRKSHHLAPHQDLDFEVLTQAEVLRTLNTVSMLLTALLMAVAAISLLIAGIGIMNIMYISVTARTKEIGLRISIGARGKDILRQFLLESVLICIIGGGIGVTIGETLSLSIGIILSWPPTANTIPVLVSFTFCTLIGVFFGYYPALKASRLDPIEALRYE